MKHKKLDKVQCNEDYWDEMGRAGQLSSAIYIYVYMYPKQVK